MSGDQVYDTDSSDTDSGGTDSSGWADYWNIVLSDSVYTSILPDSLLDTVSQGPFISILFPDVTSNAPINNTDFTTYDPFRLDDFHIFDAGPTQDSSTNIGQVQTIDQIQTLSINNGGVVTAYYDGIRLEAHYDLGDEQWFESTINWFDAKGNFYKQTGVTDAGDTWTSFIANGHVEPPRVRRRLVSLS